MKQDKFKKMITSGERMEEKRKNIEKELLEEELDLIDQFQTGTVVKEIPNGMFRVHLDHNNQRFDCYLSSDICRDGLLLGSRVKVKNNGFFKCIIYIFPLLCF